MKEPETWPEFIYSTREVLPAWIRRRFAIATTTVLAYLAWPPVKLIWDTTARFAQHPIETLARFGVPI